MKRLRRGTLIQSYVLFAFTAGTLVPPAVLAENPNPFGTMGKQPSPNPEQPQTPPGFSEDDEFPPDANFGFNPPPPSNGGDPQDDPGPAQPPPPAQVFNPPPTNTGRTTAPAQPSPAPRARTFPTPSGTGTAKATASPDSKIKPQKLADYLELDSSVKGLEVKNFDLPDKDIKDVVTLISKWTGKNFIIDNKVRGKITIMGPSQVTLQEAYQAFLSALEANGLTTVQSGKFIRIIESAEARRAPVKTYAGDFAPKDDQFITRIFQLKYINADEVQREFRDLTTRQGKLFAYEPTNSIIITDTGSNIQRIKEILETLDVKNFETTLHVLRIKNTSAKQISEMLGEIYGDDRKGGATGARSFRRSSLERTRGGGIISKIIPDEATNSLIVLANAAGYTQLNALVNRLDIKQNDSGKIHVYYCEYAKAEDLAATLAALSGSGGGAGRTSSSRRNTPSPTTPGAPPTTSTGLGSSGPVTAELDGGVKITSDAATNSLVITANASDYKTLRRVIRKLDIPRLQVLIETAILEVGLSKKRNVGINTAIVPPGAGTGAGFIGNQADVLGYLAGTPGEGLTLPFVFGESSTATIGGRTAEVKSFMSLINLLAKETETSVLSTPQILALDNEKAEFKVVDKIPVQSTFTLSQGATGAGAIGTGTLEKLETGIEIKLTPHVNAASRTIRLEIEQKVDNVASSNDVPSALQSISKAVTSRVTNTSVVVKDLNYVMLSGLISDKIDDTVTKVPLLGDIPILGWLFKSKNSDVRKTNLVVLLRPKIIGTTVDSAQVVAENLKRRDKFIEKNFTNPPEEHKEITQEIQNNVKNQEKRGQGEPIFDYRNNEDDEDDRPRPGEQSELRPRSAPTPKARREDSPEPILAAPPGVYPPPGYPPPGSNMPPPQFQQPPPQPGFQPDTPLLEGGGNTLEE